MNKIIKSLENMNNDFDLIKISIASPEKLGLGLLEKLKNLKQLIIEPLNQREKVFFVQKYLVL